MRFTLFIFIMAVVFTAGCKKEEPGPNEVFITGGEFSPSSLTVSVGTKVTWTNKESSAHTVTSDSGPMLSSIDMGKTQTYTFTFFTAGTYPYHCKFHSSMKGTVVVQ
ncbi:MAG: cupredoxin domain-containing protein [Flavobacteriales bacterium]